MTLRYLSTTGGFIPQATGQVISYIRTPSEFPINRYAQYIETPTTVGVYARIDRAQPARVVSDADFVWADGADRPSGDWNQLRFEWVEFSVKRRDYPFRVGNMALKNAKKSWSPLEQHTGMVAQQAMTNRTNRVVDLLETTSNWNDNVDSANSLNGGAGPWHEASDQPGSPSYNAIRKSLMRAANRINLKTNGVVQPKDLVLLVSPGLAEAMGNSAEMHNYIKFAVGQKAIEDPGNVNQTWGLPAKVYGFDLVVENSPIVTSRPYAADTSTSLTETRAYCKSDDSAILMSRKGGINGNYGAPSFSTVQLYFYEWEMAVYSFDDPHHERHEGHVVEAYSEVLAAPESGYLITNTLSA